MAHGVGGVAPPAQGGGAGPDGSMDALRLPGAESGTGERPSEQRIREVQALSGIDYFVVTCPKDLTMYMAAAVAVGGVALEVVELTALLERSVGSTP